ncbi:MAG TPA: hypothetical protein QGH10_17890, partial [Armatimonadota bacterium]|nr:hypothetical protein [Armatimonadota bacterium]
PWFHQYYYYAVNGITDDRGWSMHSWDGESAWVELTLNEPSDIGRVVLHTPNITDYQLDFIAPGAPTSRITVTGNAEAEITHNMQPALPCLKLRLTVTAARDVGVNGGKPMLSEIEAYAEPGEGVVSPIEAIEGAAAADVDVLFGEQADPPRLWEDDFTDFAPAPKYYWDERDGNWVLDAEKYAAKARPGGGLVAVSTSAEGYAGMTRILPYTPEHRFFQVMVEDIEGDGYRYASVNFSNPSGTKGYRGGINSSKPGLYTVDTHAIHENFATGTDKKCFVRIGSAGSSKKPDDTITPGPQFTFGWVRLSGVPENGLVVTHADGAPLGFSIKPGDVLHLELHLAAPAQDAVVEVVTGPSYAPLAINGDPYVQLHASDETARVWVGEVTVGEGTGKFKLGGYPALFKASVVGSDITETFASASVSFE